METNCYGCKKYMLVTKELTRYILRSLNQCTVQTFTESEDTRCCVNKIFPPEDEHVNARNMSRIIV